MTDRTDLPQAARDPGDICACGDSRGQHKQGGTGPCGLGSLCTPHQCMRFRLCWTKAEHEINEADLQRRAREQADRRKANAQA